MSHGQDADALDVSHPTTPPLSVAGDRCPLGHPTHPDQSFCPLCGTLLRPGSGDCGVATPDPVPHATKGMGRAGSSARRQYEAMRKSWLRRIRLRFWLFSAGLALFLVLPIGLYSAAHPRWVWGFGFAAGASIAMMIGIREFPPGYITNWEDGAQGEEWTAKELRPLSKQGWMVMHDLRDKRGDGKGNFDHVLVGPSGVFLLDSKSWPGITTIENGLPTLRRHEDPDLPAHVYEFLPGRQRAAATRLNKALKAETRIAVWVTPVVVVWGGFPQKQVSHDGVVFIRGDLVCAWIREQPVKLVPEHQSRVTEGLREALVLA